jgi:hypothetical protein
MKAGNIIIKLVYIVIFATLLGCSLMKRSSSIKNQWSNEQYNKGRVNSLVHSKGRAKMQYLAFNTDSASAAYMIKLWPKGKISFNAATGFEGEFDSVQMHGVSKNIARNSNLLRNEVEDELDQRIGVNLENSQQTSAKAIAKKSNPDYLLIGIITSLLLIGIYFWLKRIIF